MNGRTFLKRVGGVIVGLVTAIGLVKAKPDKSDKFFYVADFYGRDDNGNMRLLGTEFLDYDYFIPAKYDDHERHVKAYNDYMAGDQWPGEVQKQLTQFNRKEEL